MKHVMLITPQHTGTRWMVNFLLDAGMESMVDMGVAEKVFTVNPDRYPMPADNPDGHVTVGQKFTNRTILFSHIKEGVNQWLTGFVHLFPTIVTVRDPLRAFITNYNWFYNHGDRRGGWRGPIQTGITFETMVVKHITAWLFLLRLDKHVGDHIQYVCMDQLEVAEPLVRMNFLQRLLSRCDLSNTICGVVGKEWRFVFSHGQTPLHRCFIDGDVAELKNVLGMGWNVLRQSEDKLRPFLERLGYHDLLWWS